MDEDRIIEMVAEHFGIRPDEDGKYDTESYDWQAGCSLGGGKWLNLAEVVECTKQILDEIGMLEEKPYHRDNMER